MANNNNNNNDKVKQPEKAEKKLDAGRAAILEERLKRRKEKREKKVVRAEEKKKRIAMYRPPPRRAAYRAPAVHHPKITASMDKFPVGCADFNGLVMEKKHLEEKVLEVYEQADMASELKDVEANELLKMIEDASIDWTDALKSGVDYYGNQSYKKAPMMKNNLNALVTYVDSPKAAPDIKVKLLFVIKALRTNHDALGVVVMMASHSAVCNVQKEIGVRLAYSALQDTLKSDCDANDPKNIVLRLLYECREMCIENLYVAQALNGQRTLNSHPLMGYRNAIHDQIGLNKVPDPDTSNNPTAKNYVGTFFERFYTLETIIQCILKALNETPRKLNYNAVVSFLQYNRPEKFKDDAEEFLFHCFDDDGKFTMGCVAWMMLKMGVFKLKEGLEKLDENLLFPDLTEDEVDEIRKSVGDELKKSLTGADNNTLAKSADEIRHSVEAVLAASAEYLENEEIKEQGVKIEVKK